MLLHQGAIVVAGGAFGVYSAPFEVINALEVLSFRRGFRRGYACRFFLFELEERPLFGRGQVAAERRQRDVVCGTIDVRVRNGGFHVIVIAFACDKRSAWISADEKVSPL